MRKEVDFLVIGSGIAGLCFALKAANFGKVCMVTKAKMDDGSTRYAQGGIASVIYKPDTYEKHIQDTMVAGDELSDRHIVELTIREATDRVMELVQWGVDFDKNQDGSFALGKEGGHSMNFPAGMDFMKRQRKGSPADWKLPSKGRGNTESLSK